MKILLDHNLDWRLAKDLPGHDVRTTAQMVWDILTNGVLLGEAEKAGFSVLLTADKGIKNQQTMSGRAMAVVILRAPNNKLETHLTMIPDVIRVIKIIQPGTIVEVFHADLTPRQP